MTYATETIEQDDFRHGPMQRFSAAILIGMMGMVILMLAGLGAEVILDGEIILGLGLLGMAIFLATIARAMVRDFVYRSRWHVRLEDAEASLHLPVWRLSSGAEPSLTGPLPYSSIAAIEWREEAMRSMGISSLSRVYAIRLKSGALIALGEDRPERHSKTYTSLVGDAARALASRAGAQIVERPMAEGKTGFLGLWGNERAPWPEDDAPGTLSEADARSIRRGLLLTQLFPAAAFAVMILARLFG